jgi:hypothetical protein
LETEVALDESFAFASFRSRPDEKGDYLLLDGFNGQGRNPYHCFAILELRMDGCTVLKGYENQLVVKVDGMVEPEVALYAALKDYGVVGDVAFAVGEVPNVGFCNWRRTVAQRVGRYALVVDRVRFRDAIESAEILTKWQGKDVLWDEEAGILRVSAEDSPAASVICPCDPVPARLDGAVVSLIRTVEARKDEEVILFSLIALDDASTKGGPRASCARLSANSVLLRYPGSNGRLELGLAVTGPHDCTDAEVAILTPSHLFGLRLTRVGPDRPMIASSAPVDVDWDFEAGSLVIEAEREMDLSLVLASASARLDGQSATGRAAKDGLVSFTVPEGRHVLKDARPPEEMLQEIGKAHETAGKHVESAQQEVSPDGAQAPAESAASHLAESFSADIGSAVVDTTVIEAGG